MSLDEVRARLSGAAIMLDFDGSLAPIVPEPEDAYPWPGVAEVLADLVDRAALVAIVTGRPESFIRGVLDVPKLEVIGLYGLEGAAPLGPDVSEALRSLAATEPGARIEHKGVSVSVHVRGAPDPEAATAASVDGRGRSRPASGSPCSRASGSSSSLPPAPARAGWFANSWFGSNRQRRCMRATTSRTAKRSVPSTN